MAGNNSNAIIEQLPFLRGGGEMGHLIRSKDWKNTALGEPATWPPALKYNVSNLLAAYFPVLICWGSDYIQLYNDAFMPTLGSSKHPDALGNAARSSFAEIWDTVAPMFARVMKGETIAYDDLVLPLEKNGRIEQCHFSFSYSPILDEHGVESGILVNCVETTEKVNALERVKTERENIRNMVLQAPVGMCIVSGQPLMVEEINDFFLEIIGKRREAFAHTPYWVVNAEASAFYQPITDKVMATGTSFHANEHEIVLLRNGVAETVFVDFVYEPVRNPQGKTDAIMIVAIDVTEKVLARKGMEKNATNFEVFNNELTIANEKLNQALASAHMGTWSANLEEQRLIVSPKTSTMHGLVPGEQLTLEESLLMIVPAHRDKIKAAIEKAIAEKSNFQEEYQIQPKDGSSLKWLRSTGKVFLNTENEPAFISGTILDITGNKLAEQQKDDFISVASHELKTPVTVLKGTLQLLEQVKGNQSAELLDTLIAQANRSVEKIIVLINELLHASRIKEGQLQLSLTIFSFEDMMKGCCIQLRQSKKHKLIITGDTHLQIMADESRISQVVENLVNNAVKYAANSEAIYIHIKKSGDDAKITITDNGPGIAADKIPNLFTRYYRADYSGTSYSGLGLGLYISAEIIKRHGGKIGVNSELGKGSEFWFTLALAPNQPSGSNSNSVE